MATLTESLTYAELVSKINTGTLNKGASYTITDFATKEAAHGQTAVIITGTTEPLLVRATSASTISEVVDSVLFPTDFIKYDITNVLCEDGTTARKGRIIRRTDANGNSTPWDFLAVKHLVKTFTAPVYNAGTTYTYGRLVTYNGWIWKAASSNGTGPEVGAVPGVSWEWIKYLPVGSLLLPKELVASDKAVNCGNVLYDGVTYGTAQYFYTFTNTLGEECSHLFKGFEIGQGSSNIVCFAEANKTLTGLKIGDNSVGLRLTGNLYNSEIGAGSAYTIIYTGITHSYLCQSNRNLLGHIWSSRSATVFSGNIIHVAGLGTLFQSETVFNDIDYVNDCVVGADFFTNRVVKMVYAGIGYRFTGNYVNDMTGITTVGLCYACFFPDLCTDIFISGVCNSVNFPQINSLFFEGIITGGYDLSANTSLQNELAYKKIVGDDSGVFLLTRGEGGAEVITAL